MRDGEISCIIQCPAQYIIKKTKSTNFKIRGKRIQYCQHRSLGCCCGMGVAKKKKKWSDASDFLEEKKNHPRNAFPIMLVSNVENFSHGKIQKFLLLMHLFLYNYLRMCSKNGTKLINREQNE